MICCILLPLLCMVQYTDKTLLGTLLLRYMPMKTTKRERERERMCYAQNIVALDEAKYFKNSEKHDRLENLKRKDEFNPNEAKKKKLT